MLPLAYLSQVKCSIMHCMGVDVNNSIYEYCFSFSRRPCTYNKFRPLLRLLLVQQWFRLSDLGAEELAADSMAVRNFMDSDQTNQKPPDKSTTLKFQAHDAEEQSSRDGDTRP